MKPKVPKNIIRRFLFKCVKHKLFNKFILLVICLNTVVLAIDYYGSPEAYKTAINNINTVFVVIFAIEMLMKIGGTGFMFYLR